MREIDRQTDLGEVVLACVVNKAAVRILLTTCFMRTLAWLERTGPSLSLKNTCSWKKERKCVNHFRNIIYTHTKTCSRVFQLYGIMWEKPIHCATIWHQRKLNSAEVQWHAFAGRGHYSNSFVLTLARRYCRSHTTTTTMCTQQHYKHTHLAYHRCLLFM